MPAAVAYGPGKHLFRHCRVSLYSIGDLRQAGVTITAVCAFIDRLRMHWPGSCAFAQYSACQGQARVCLAGESAFEAA